MNRLGRHSLAASLSIRVVDADEMNRFNEEI